MSDVIFLAHRNPALTTERSAPEMLACRTCRNKTYLVRYFEGAPFPTLTCACCGCDAGKIGWAHPEQEDKAS